MNFLPPYTTKVWKIIGGVVGGLVLLALILFAASRISNWWTDRGIRKDKAKIANTVNEIANISNQIGNLEIQKAEKQGELKKDIEDLQNQTIGREEAKKESNAALANFNAALKSNSNVNATAEDIQKALDKLDQQ